MLARKSGILYHMTTSLVTIQHIYSEKNPPTSRALSNNFASSEELIHKFANAEERKKIMNGN